MDGGGNIKIFQTDKISLKLPETSTMEFISSEREIEKYKTARTKKLCQTMA